jgi:hypothetical protein
MAITKLTDLIEGPNAPVTLEWARKVEAAKLELLRAKRRAELDDRPAKKDLSGVKYV